MNYSGERKNDGCTTNTLFMYRLIETLGEFNSQISTIRMEITLLI